MTGQLGAQAAAQWVLDRSESTTQWSIVKQGSSGSVLCSRASPAVYSQPALEVIHSHHELALFFAKPPEPLQAADRQEHYYNSNLQVFQPLLGTIRCVLTQS